MITFLRVAYVGWHNKYAVPRCGDVGNNQAAHISEIVGYACEFMRGVLLHRASFLLVEIFGYRLGIVQQDRWHPT